jgi:P pilus assembly chaperone PapD
VQALLRISMPLFVVPPGVAPNVEWSVERADDKTWLVLENTGTAHAQITAARTEAGDDVPAVGYLLPGEKRRVAVTAAPSRIVATLRDQPERTFPVRAMP